jgi:hypothetical protein
MWCTGCPLGCVRHLERMLVVSRRTAPCSSSLQPPPCPHVRCQDPTLASPWALPAKSFRTPRDGIVTHPPHGAEGVESTSGHDTATEGTRAAARWVAWARRGEGAGGGRYRLPDVHRGGHWCDDGGQRAVPRPQGAGPSVCQSLTLCSGGFRDGMWPLSVVERYSSTVRSRVCSLCGRGRVQGKT